MTTVKMSVEQIAAVCHEANREYCRKLGDTSHKDWVNAPEWQRQSAMDGVWFHLENPKASAAASHENWLKDKKKDGWKYGKAKNEDTREHPCVVPFAELPPEQQAKDWLFKGIVDALRALS